MAYYDNYAETGLIGGIGKGISDASTLLLTNNLDTIRQQKLQRLRGEAALASDDRRAESAMERTTAELTSKESEGAANRASAEKIAEIRSKADGNLTEAERIKGLNKDLAELDSEIRESQQLGTPMTDEQIKDAYSQIYTRWNSGGAVDLDEDRVAAAASKIREHLEGGAKGKGGDTDNTPEPDATTEKPEESGLLTTTPEPKQTGIGRFMDASRERGRQRQQGYDDIAAKVISHINETGGTKGLSINELQSAIKAPNIPAKDKEMLQEYLRRHRN